MMKTNDSYLVTVYGAKDLIYKRDGKRYVFKAALSKVLKDIDSPHTPVVRQRFLWLVQFNINTVRMFGIDAIDIDDIYRKDHSGSIQFKFVDTPGTNTIAEVQE